MLTLAITMGRHELEKNSTDNSLAKSKASAKHALINAAMLTAAKFHVTIEVGEI